MLAGIDVEEVIFGVAKALVPEPSVIVVPTPVVPIPVKAIVKVSSVACVLQTYIEFIFIALSAATVTIASTAVETGMIADNQVTLAKMAGLARGKIIYGDASGDPAALAVGNANEVLTSDGTDISWAAASSGVSAGKAIAFSLIF